MPTLAEEFSAFWALYPRRVSRPDAMKAYGQARVTATAEEILAGVRLFLANLPEEMRYVPYPASWLRAGRWADEYAELNAPRLQFDKCDHVPTCNSPQWCLVLRDRERQQRESA